jgi:hypothetical protein
MGQANRPMDHLFKLPAYRQKRASGRASLFC